MELTAQSSVSCSAQVSNSMSNLTIILLTLCHLSSRRVQAMGLDGQRASEYKSGTKDDHRPRYFQRRFRSGIFLTSEQGHREQRILLFTQFISPEL